MTALKRSLKVYLIYVEDDLSVVGLFAERLKWDGLELTLVEFSGIETGRQDSEPALLGDEKRKSVEEAVHTSDVVLLCTSRRFFERASLNPDWQFVLDAAADKSQGSISILQVRLEDCIIPSSMHRWPSFDLYASDGYEKTMLALKFQADMTDAGLEVHPGWKARFEYPRPRSPQPRGRQQWNSTPILIALVAVAMVLVLAYLTRGPVSETPVATTVAVDVIEANATRNARLDVTAQAETLIALYVPATQTAQYLTSVPVTQTAERITPTLTVTSTATLTPTVTLTTVPLPAQVLAAGDVPMVLVPGGSFIMGIDGNSDASPAASIDLGPYYIDQFEVTNASYQKCVLAGTCQPPVVASSQTRPNYYNLFANYPVINVDWNMARTFCEWRGARLPTEAEWEKAARGADQSSYPWGELILCPFANYTAAEGACIGDTQAVDSYAATPSRYNALNMAGNVAEWVASLYSPYPYDAQDGRNDPALDGPRVVRGGSWASQEVEVMTYYRVSLDPSSYAIFGNDLGFRCVQGVGR